MKSIRYILSEEPTLLTSKMREHGDLQCIYIFFT